MGNVKIICGLKWEDSGGGTLWVTRDGDWDFKLGSSLFKPDGPWFAHGSSRDGFRRIPMQSGNTMEETVAKVIALYRKHNPISTDELPEKVLIDVSGNWYRTDGYMAAAEGLILYRRVRGAAMNKGGSNQRVLTPPELVSAVVKRFGQPYIDLAASDGDQIAGVKKWITPEQNSLESDWGTFMAWLNPQFANMRPWVEKCAFQRENLHILLLCHSAHGSAWWRDFVQPYAYVYELGRVKFVGYSAGGMKDMALCHYGPGIEPGTEYWDWKKELSK